MLVDIDGVAGGAVGEPGGIAPGVDPGRQTPTDPTEPQLSPEEVQEQQRIGSELARVKRAHQTEHNSRLELAKQVEDLKKQLASVAPKTDNVLEHPALKGLQTDDSSGMLQVEYPANSGNWVSPDLVTSQYDISQRTQQALDTARAVAEQAFNARRNALRDSGVAMVKGMREVMIPGLSEDIAEQLDAQVLNSIKAQLPWDQSPESIDSDQLESVVKGVLGTYAAVSTAQIGAQTMDGQRFRELHPSPPATRTPGVTGPGSAWDPVNRNQSEDRARKIAAAAEARRQR